MKSLIPIFFCNLYLLIVITRGLNLVILVSEKPYPDMRTKRDPESNLTYLFPSVTEDGETFVD